MIWISSKQSGESKNIHGALHGKPRDENLVGKPIACYEEEGI